MDTSFFKKISEIVVYILIIIAVVFLVPKVSSVILKTPYPIAAISSSSMWPSLKAGDLILIKGIRKENLEIGDIVVYKNTNQNIGFTVHRIVEIKDDTFVTRGDANSVNDKPVDYNNLIGKVVGFDKKPLRIPWLGKITMWVN